MEGGIATLVGTGWASGVNLYGTVLLLGIFGRLEVAAVPDLLESWPVMAAAAVFYVVELVADKVPYLDNAWDVVHTAIRPLGAAVVGGILAGEVDVSTITGAMTSGGMALGSHATKAGARVALNASPEPVSNTIVSLSEDGIVAGMVWLAIEYPLVAGIAAVVLLVGGILVLVALWRVVRRGWQRLRSSRRPSAGDGVRPPA